MSHAPVIIIGMHRSGTTLLTRVLQQAGFFMGAGATRNEEAAFTNAINEWLFRQASATWDRPESMDDLLGDGELRPDLVDYIDGMIRGPASLRFLGPLRWLQEPGMTRIRTPWGWKDPRNTWTLPLWLEVFPNARVLHIVRHGVDVAESLRARRARTTAERLARYRRRRAFHRMSPLAPKRRGLGPQPRCRTLEGGFSLWEAYVRRAREHVQALGSRALEVRYEALLADPVVQLRQTLSFCGCEPDEDDIARAGSLFDAGRAHAWRDDPKLRTFARSVTERLAAAGYVD